jgi:putative DNA primase/helicase
MIPDQLKGQRFRFTKLKPVVLGDKNSGKNPVGAEWNTINNSFTETEIPDGISYGICTGFGGACVIDIDNIDGRAAFDTKMPETLTDGIGDVSRHYYYKCPELHVGPFNIFNEDGIKIAEIKSNGANAVAPNSPNWRGGKREIVNPAPVRVLSVSELVDIFSGYSTNAKKHVSLKTAIENMMKRKVQFSITEILEHFKWEPTVGGGNEWKGVVPCHGSVSGTCLSINVEDEVWFCHACQRGGGKESLILLLAGVIACADIYRDHKSKLRQTMIDVGMIQDIQPKGDNFENTEGGNALRFKKLHGENVRYCSQTKTWYIWDGNRWAEDAASTIHAMANEVIDYLYSLMPDSGEEKGPCWAKSSDTLHGRNAMLTLASRDPDIAISIAELDSDPMKMTFEGGTVDFRNATSYPPKREDYITLIGGCKLDPDATGARWDKFVTEVWPDEEIRNWVQRCVGYGISGDMSQKCFFYCDDATGDGDNGKSVFQTTIRRVCGEYGIHANMDTFLRKKNSRDIRDDLVSLRGKRFISAGEPGDDAVLNMEVLKPWTGGDPIRARSLYQKEIQFNPQATIWLAGNTRPLITETTAAAWDRIKVIPFHVSFKGRIDRMLRNKLDNELSAVLRWCIQGYTEYLKHGLTPPVGADVTHREYRLSCNSLETFISVDYRVIKGERYKVRRAELHKEYKEYCAEYGYFALSPRKVGRYLLSAHGIAVTRDMTAEYYDGIKLASNSSSEELELALKETPGYIKAKASWCGS